MQIKFNLWRTQPKIPTSKMLSIAPHGIKITSSPAKILVERLGDLKDTLDVVHGQR